MGQERLNRLEVLHIHSDGNVDIDEVVASFGRKRALRLTAVEILNSD